MLNEIKICALCAHEIQQFPFTRTTKTFGVFKLTFNNSGCKVKLINFRQIK